MNTETIIVAGLTGSGKSTFTEKRLLPGIRGRGLDPNKDVDIQQFDRANDDIGLSTKPVTIVHFNTHVESDQHSVEEMRVSREEKLMSFLRNKAETSKLYLCYTPDHMLAERIKSRTGTDPKRNGALSNVNQRHSLLQLVEKFAPAVSDTQIVFLGEVKIELMTADEFQHGLPSETLEAIINHSPILVRAKDTVFKSVRNFISRNTVLRGFLIALRHRLSQIRS